MDLPALSDLAFAAAGTAADRGRRSRRAQVMPAALLVAIVVVLTIVPAGAVAHVPVLEPESPSDSPPATDGDVDPFPAAIALPDPSVSRAVYGVLAEGEAFDVYRFSVAEPIEIPVGILVPRRPELAGFRPSFAVIGPDLGDAVGGADAADLPSALGRRLTDAGRTSPSALRMGAVVGGGPSADWGSFFEPFSFERYHQGPDLQVSLQPGQDYYVVVYDPSGATGDYVLGMGTREAFTPADVVRSIVAVGRIKLGLYGQGSLRWGTLAVAVSLAATVAAVVTLLVVRSRRRRRRSA